jgi:hypothetical protein
MDGGTSDQAKASNVPLRAHFEALAETLRTEAQAKANGYWESRDFHVTAHDGFLALSWSGSLGYAMGHAYTRRLKAKNKKNREWAEAQGRTPPRDDPGPDRDIANAVRDSYKTKRAGHYAQEAYIFQKQSEIPPDVLKRFGVDLVDGYGALPLHHYFRISRCQPVVEKGENPVFTRWTIDKVTHHSAQSLITTLLKEVYVSACPDKIEDEPCPWWVKLLIGLVVIGALGLSAWLGLVVYERLTKVEDDVAALEVEVDGLAARYDGLEARLDTLGEGLATGAQLQAVLEALDDLDRRLGEPSAQVDQTPEQGREQGREQAHSQGQIPGAPACLQINSVNGRVVPDYLFRAHIAPEGIRVFAHSGNRLAANQQPRAEALSQLRDWPTGRMDASSFANWADRLVSPDDDCRHYVVIHESQAGNARDYIALRSAIERRFYIYRGGNR